MRPISEELRKVLSATYAPTPHRFEYESGWGNFCMKALDCVGGIVRCGLSESNPIHVNTPEGEK